MNRAVVYLCILIVTVAHAEPGSVGAREADLFGDSTPAPDKPRADRESTLFGE